MKESIMSFFNAPVTNKVPAGVCSVASCLYLLRFPFEGTDAKGKGRCGK